MNSPVWYKYTPTENGILTVDTCGSALDTSVVIFEGCADLAERNIIEYGSSSVRCSNDVDIQVDVTSGTCYAIEVGSGVAATGTGTLTLGFRLLPDCAATAGCVNGYVDKLSGICYDDNQCRTESVPHTHASCTLSPICDTACAGTAYKSGITQNCYSDSFCMISNYCDTCSDEVKDGAETDVDCGGPCSDCAVGQHCTINEECQTFNCVAGTCAAADCEATTACYDWLDDSNIIPAYTFGDWNCYSDDSCDIPIQNSYYACQIGMSECNTFCGSSTTYQDGLRSEDCYSGEACVATALCLPPVNDYCEDATAINLGDTIFSTGAASTEYDYQPLEYLSCGGVENEVWYKYTPASDGVLTIDACDSDFNTKVAVYEASTCEALVDSQTGACNDDSCGTGGTRSSVNLYVTEGTDYIIWIGGSGASDKGTGTLTLSQSASCSVDCPIDAPCFVDET
jgi:hypothetical protein